MWGKLKYKEVKMLSKISANITAGQPNQPKANNIAFGMCKIKVDTESLDSFFSPLIESPETKKNAKKEIINFAKKIMKKHNAQKGAETAMNDTITISDFRIQTQPKRTVFSLSAQKGTGEQQIHRTYIQHQSKPISMSHIINYSERGINDVVGGIIGDVSHGANRTDMIKLYDDKFDTIRVGRK